MNSEIASPRNKRVSRFCLFHVGKVPGIIVYDLVQAGTDACRLCADKHCGNGYGDARPRDLLFQWFVLHLLPGMPYSVRRRFLAEEYCGHSHN